MYDKDELVKRLRDRAGSFDYDGRPDIACDYEQAADAIEELQADKATLNDTVTNLLEQIKDIGKPRWIPVTERLPQEWWPVLGLIQFCDKEEPPAQQVLWYLGNGHWRETWKGNMVESDVTHWMPLPEPPKEE